jgi:hypothetical protein
MHEIIVNKMVTSTQNSSHVEASPKTQNDMAEEKKIKYFLQKNHPEQKRVCVCVCVWFLRQSLAAYRPRLTLNFFFFSCPGI